MAIRKTPGELYDPRTGERSIRINPVQFDAIPFEPPRTNCFSIYRIVTGSGSIWADASRFAFTSPSLLFFVPYQRIRFIPDSLVEGDVIRFHANFLCIETFHAEVGCSSILFSDPLGGPYVTLNGETSREVSHVMKRLRREQDEGGLASTEVMLAYLKILLILATRLKATRNAGCSPGLGDPRHSTLQRFHELIERHYQSWHSPAQYATALHMTAKTLGRMVRDHLGTTPTDLIRNRILTHAKWELLHTLKPVKEVAREVGFDDELYFSRLFKKATGYSPTFFREFETQIRGGSNLSISSGHSSIL